MNEAVATTERGDSRAMPHTPCPLVHPLPVTLPKPTNRPPITKSAWLSVTV